jgi:regulator of protease activity HflC (stomatin/prohibitin superfamily)
MWGIVFGALAVLTIIGFLLNAGIGLVLLVLLSLFFLISLRVVMEYERGIVFTFGRYSAMLKPGLNFVVPIAQRAVTVDLRVAVEDVPEQSPITKDNVSQFLHDQQKICLH